MAILSKVSFENSSLQNPPANLLILVKVFNVWKDKPPGNAEK
jgi:hypothetical protein